jgi:hypothetical protein
MKVEEVLIGIVAALVISAVCWLVKEVLDIRSQLVKLQTEVSLQIKMIMKNCTRHQQWSGKLQSDLHRMDRNLAALCAKHNVQHEAPPDENVDFSNGEEDKDE